MTAPPRVRTTANAVHPAWCDALPYEFIYDGWSWQEPLSA
jgi:hypothetical protein